MNQKRLGPRKIVVGSAMHNMFRPYPGLETRLAELANLIDQMAVKAATRYSGAQLDLAALPEMAINGGRTGTAAEVSYPLDGPVLDVMGAKARQHQCYITVPLYLVDDAEQGGYSNAVALLDRNGEVAGIYRKVFVVIDANGETAEGGVAPGTDFPVFDCDFGRIGIQICYDMAFDEGWEALSRKGAELVVWPTQWPGQIYPASRALRGPYFVLSSTWRNNVSLFDPLGQLLRARYDEGIFVEQIDLDYALLHWQPTLRNGKAFEEAFGERAGFRYSEAEDGGIFWSNDPALPITEMVEQLHLETMSEAYRHARRAQERLRGGPPRLD